ncbi:hypothetical protein BKH46_02380 [Helicobacter sp. 12S02634-8]|uniref:TonB-dependent receptor domain-containing protein n=1 Tax=Helicobacter sp. 12S02634-8 TaxID=1476199 RepID=UPI000BA6E37D|nr:TonB-dependent receptor [Helicobacter sp. 12S02634-8]PAF48174.1 hypothetical protein BKH46_02380 [Helicobacter sp. 12S02634-8]
MQLLYFKNPILCIKSPSKIFIFLLTYHLSLFAQDQEKTYTLNKSVVSASGFAQDLKDAPASISVITKQQLESRPFKDIGEAVSLVPGVSIDTNQGQNGAYPISIRGMPAAYTLILIDGKRQDVTSAAFPNGYGDWTFSGFMPPLAMIERIEVIKGPMSTLYGSDAIGGVINIITKKNLDKWGSSFSLESTFEEKKYLGNIYSGSFYTSGPLDKAKKWGISLRGREWYRAFVPLKNMSVFKDTKGLNPTQTGYNGSDGKVSIETNNYNIGTRLSYRPDNNNYTYLDAFWADQYLNNNRPIYSLSANKKLHALRQNIILAHLGNYSFGKTDTSLQYNSTQLHGRPIDLKTDPRDRDLRGDDVLVDSKLVMGLTSSKLTLGGRYWFSSMNDRVLVQKSFIYQHNASLFAENELAITDDLFLTLGIRENWNSSFGFNTSPRAYLVYNATDYLTLKGGVSTGYKTPGINQAVKGVYNYGKNGRFIYGNPSLKPESSINFEASILSETDYTDAGITGFYNLFNDKITSAGTKDQGALLPDGEICVHKISSGSGGCEYNINADSAKTYGAEVFFTLKPLNIGFGNIGFNLNYAFTRSLITSGEGKGLPLNEIPAHNLNAQLNYTFKKVGFYLRSEYRAHQIFKVGRGYSKLSDLQSFRALNPDHWYFKPYFLLHLGGNYDITPQIRVNVGVYNLLDHDFIDYSNINNGGKGGKVSTSLYNNYAYVHEGRRYFVSLNMDF